MTAEINYVVHEQPAKKQAQNYIAMVDLAPFGFEGSMEQLWLSPAVDGMHQVGCLPFRDYGLALGDLVALDEDGRTVQRLVKSPGHRVFRVFLEDAAVGERVRAAIAECGLVAEWSGVRHVAVHVPAGEGLHEPLRVAVEEAPAGTTYCEWADVEPFSVGGVTDVNL